MKEKILQALKTKYQNFGFNEKALDGVAAYLSTSINEETEIENAIGGLESMFKVFQSEQDVLRGSKSQAEKRAAELEEQLKALKGTPKQPDVQVKKDANDEQMAKMIDALNALTNKINAMEGEKVADLRRAEWSKIIGKLPDQLRKPYERIAVDKMTDDEFQSLITETNTDVDATLKEYGQQKSVFGIPSATRQEQKTQASKDEIDAVMAGIKI